MGLPPSTDLTDGTFTAVVDASWSGGFPDRINTMTAVSATAKVVAEKLSGHYSDYAVKGLSTRLVLSTQGFESIVMTQPASVFVGAVESGVDVADLTASYQIRWKLSEDLPIIDIRDFRCEIFGGTISSPGSVVDLAKLPAATTFTLQNLDLAKIFSVEQQKGLQGTGTLHGTIPVTITADGIIVKDGMLEAQPPGGTIRYASTLEPSKTISESDRQLQLVAQTLNNFQYSLLRVGVEYDETGMLDLNARLEGRNPDLRNTPLIHFNLTVQEHIPTLLKSLRMVEDSHGTTERR